MQTVSCCGSKTCCHRPMPIRKRFMHATFSLLSWLSRSGTSPTNSAKCSSLTSWRGAASKSCRQKAASTSIPCSRASATRCFVCANGSRAFTTSSRRGEGTRYEKETDLLDPAGHRWIRTLHRDRRPGGDAPVELAAAHDLRLAADHLLAGARTPGSLPDPLRRPRWRRRLSPRHAAANGRALRPHEPGGAGEARREAPRPLGTRAAARLEARRGAPMTRTTNARVAGFTFPFYIAVTTECSEPP